MYFTQNLASWLTSNVSDDMTLYRTEYNMQNVQGRSSISSEAA